MKGWCLVRIYHAWPSYPWPTSAAPHQRALYPDIPYLDLTFPYVNLAAPVAVLGGSVLTHISMALSIGRGYGPPQCRM